MPHCPVKSHYPLIFCSLVKLLSLQFLTYLVQKSGDFDCHFISELKNSCFPFSRCWLCGHDKVWDGPLSVMYLSSTPRSLWCLPLQILCAALPTLCPCRDVTCEQYCCCSLLSSSQEGQGANWSTYLEHIGQGNNPTYFSRVSVNSLHLFVLMWGRKQILEQPQYHSFPLHALNYSLWVNVITFNKLIN